MPLQAPVRRDKPIHGLSAAPVIEPRDVALRRVCWIEELDEQFIKAHPHHPDKRAKHCLRCGTPVHDTVDGWLAKA